MTEWIIEVNDGQEVLGRDDGLYDVIVSDTFNPFGNFAKGFFDDVGGELFDTFQRGTKVSFQYSNDNTNGFEQRFVGYVVNDLAQEADGAEQVEVEAYTFDQFLRGDEVSNDQTGNTVFEALEDVITTDVPPVNWDASLVEVQNDVELTQSFQGERVEEFILAVQQKSAGEIFGVDENLNFFFEPSEISRTRRDIDNSQWVTHDIGEESGETKNQATVYFDDGDRAVTVDDTGDQLRLQDSLGAGGPGQEGESITRDEITNIEDAIDAGEAYLEGRAATLTGPVTTFDLNSAQPGDVIGVTIEPRGIEGDFRIAENRMQWRSETNELTVVAKKGADDDILIEQSKTLDRVEGRPRDTSVIPDRVTDSLVEAIISVSGDADGVPFEITRFTNDGRNLVRDGWINKTTIDVAEFAVSSDDSRPSRSDSSLDSELTRTTVTESLPDNYSVEYSGSVTATDVRTVGLFDASNTLLATGRLEESVSDPSITLSLTVGTAPEEDKSALVNDGQTATRDIIADNNPEFVDEYAFGSDTGDVVETDSSLTTVATNDLDAAIIQDISGSTLGENDTFPDDEPIKSTANGIEVTRTAFVGEADELDSSTGSISDVEFSGGEARLYDSTAGFVSLNFTLEHTIPEDYAQLVFRGRNDSTIRGNIELDGDILFQDTSPVPGNLGWETWDVAVSGADFGDVFAGSHTVSFDVESGSVDSGETGLQLDLVGFRDTRWGSTLDNTVHEDNGYLDGPELYPVQYPEFGSISLPTVNTDISIDELTIEQTWNDTSSNQSFTVDPPNIRFPNSDTETVSYSSRVAEVDTSVTLGAYPLQNNPQSATPRFGYNPQRISAQTLTADLDAIQRNEIGEVLVRSFTGPDTANNQTFAEGGQQSDGTLITRARIPEFVKQSTQRVVSSERLRWINDPEN